MQIKMPQATTTPATISSDLVSNTEKSCGNERLSSYRTPASTARASTDEMSP